MDFEGKMLIITAPSGAGKTTIVRHLLKKFDRLGFSVSATNRKRRPHEKEGVDYYFLSTEEFLDKVKNKEFAEWEEVYENQYYGTLKSEIDRLWKSGRHIVFDIDVKGALSLKKMYPERSLSIFIRPPSIETLLSRLVRRGSETEESLNKRIRRAKQEMAYVGEFDRVVMNDDLKKALKESEYLVEKHIFDNYNM